MDFDFTSHKLPRGVWYEADRKRYRVRLYHNNVCYHAGYYRTLDAAIKAYESLKAKLAEIPKTRRRHRDPVEPTATALAKLASHNYNPRS